MNEADKAKLEAASAEADTITDGVLMRVSQSKWSWAIVAVVLLLAAGFGWWLGK